MYVDTVPNRNSPPAVLLRSSWREGSKTRKKTLANLSSWPPEQVERLRRVLKGEPLVSPEELFVITRSLPHGHVEAVLGTLRKLGVERIIASQPSQQRDLVVAMIVEQILHHDSKLADSRNWHTTTVAQELGVADADEEDLYRALEWLYRGQSRIEKKLAGKYFSEGCYAFYDVSSSYYEGHCCPLAAFGHDRDKKKGKRIIVYGVLAEQEGRPVAVQVYRGNTGDSTTVLDQVSKLQGRFALKKVVLVGDRGMLTETQVQMLRGYPGVGWISALRSEAIGELIKDGIVHASLFDTDNLAVIHDAPGHPGERLVACYNPFLAADRRRTRDELLEATEQALGRIEREIARRSKKPLTAAEIGMKVGRVLGKYKVGKHFQSTINDSELVYCRDQKRIEQEQQLDGIYVIRTSEPEQRLSASDTVRQYKNLSQVEVIFRTVKSLDIRIRPIRHRIEERVRGHIFMCMLAYYVEWHMRKALAPLLFEDEEIGKLRRTRDPVAPAEPSASAKRKKARAQRSKEGFPVHSFQTLLQALSTRCRNTCQAKGQGAETAFTQVTEPDALQRRALELLGLMHPVAST